MNYEGGMTRQEIAELTDHQADEYVARKILGYAGPSPAFIRASSDLNVGFQAVEKIGNRLALRDGSIPATAYFELMFGMQWHARWTRITGVELYGGSSDRKERAVVNAVILAHQALASQDKIAGA